jgi:hypothetical protein
MQVCWFFATTPAPRPAHERHAAQRRKQLHARKTDAKTWWTRASDAFVAWGERSQRRYHRGEMHV